MYTKIKVVIGLSAGDEGKGLVTDYLAHKAYLAKENCIVVLSNGGSQRGHTVTLPTGERHVFRHFGSGTFIGAYTYLPKYYIVNPMNWAEEYRILMSRKAIFPPIYIHEDCLLTTPFDMIANQLIEESRGNNRHGSCGVGIWETILRDGITVGEMIKKNDEEKAQYLRFVRDDYFSNRISSKGISLNSQWKSIVYSDALINNWIYDFNLMWMNSIITNDTILKVYENIIFENGQGLLLDQDIKGYGKNTTPSNTGLKNPAEIIRGKLSEATNIEVIYVTRSYITRHGAGRFDTECSPNLISSKIIADETNKTHPFQGKLRYGVLDWKSAEERALADFNKYGDPDWNLSFFFTHLNECGIPRCYHYNYTTYMSDGLTRKSVARIH